MPLIDHPIAYGAAANQTPVQDDQSNPGMGVLCRSDGVTTANNTNKDDLNDGVWLLNQNYTPGGQNPDPPTDAEMLQLGIPAVLSGTTGTVNWHCNHDDPSVVAPVTAVPNPTADNSRLFFLAAWKRDMGNGEFVPIPQRGDTTYAAQSCGANCPAWAPPTHPAHHPKNKKSSKKSKGVNGVSSKKKAGWLHFRKIDPRTPQAGHRLLDPRGNPLRASRIKVYAFDVDWIYTAAGRLAQHVCHPVGDTLEVTPAGTIFLSPQNSLLIWQANWATRQRTLIIGQSKGSADVVDLDPSNDIFVHVNYHRLTSLKIEGSFSLAVRVLKP